MHNTRQHHYVQARYLDGFLAPPSEQLFSYGRGRAKPFLAQPDKLARQRDFYRVPHGLPDKNLETFIERFAETPGLAALRKLVGIKRPLEIIERIHLARYIAFQEMRVPYTRELTREQLSYSVHHMLQRFRETGGANAVVRQLALADGEAINRGDAFTITRQEVEALSKEMAENPDSFDLGSMVEIANDTSIFYATMRWTVLFARPSVAFLTSDCPVFRTFDTPGGDDALLRPDCKVCCPLNSSSLLVMEHDLDYLQSSKLEMSGQNGRTLPPTEFRTITDRGVQNFNRKVVEYSHLWCFSGIEHDWIVTAMHQSSKRKKPDFFASGDLSGVRWQRP